MGETRLSAPGDKRPRNRKSRDDQRVAIPQSNHDITQGGLVLKTIVLALDGLELSFIEKLGLDAFKQEKYGTYDVSMLERIFTPICFAAILTGRDPRKFGYTQKYITQAYQRGYPSWLRPLYWVRRNLFGWIKNIGIRDEMAKAGVFDLTKVHRNLNSDMKKHTIFHKLEEEYRINPIDVPSYNQKFSDSHAQFPNYLNKELFIRQKYIRDILEKVKEAWLKGIKEIENHDLTFIYSPLPDIAHHLVSHYDELSIIDDVYFQIRSLPLLFDIKKIALLIISDHGYDHKFQRDGKDIEGDHSSSGFWSVNIESEIRPSTVFDIYHLIYDLVTK